MSGCGKPVFHHNNDYEYPPRPANCDLRVVGAHPGPGYEEIGTITIEGSRDYMYEDPEAFVDRVRPELCAAGANVVVTEVNGRGYVARGIAFVNIYEDSDSHPSADASASPPPPPPPPTTGAECTPICSPGFACSAGTCIPQCNPACTPTEECGRDRLCHPRVEPAPPPPVAD